MNSLKYVQMFFVKYLQSFLEKNCCLDAHYSIHPRPRGSKECNNGRFALLALFLMKLCEPKVYR